MYDMSVMFIILQLLPYHNCRENLRDDLLSKLIVWYHTMFMMDSITRVHL